MALIQNGGEVGSLQNDGTFRYTGSTSPWNSNDVNPYMNTGGSSPTTASTAPNANPYSWQQNVQITSPDNQGGVISQAANPYQWATQDTAQNIAKQFGGNTFGMNINSPGGAWSQDQQMISRGGNNINAGLAADVLNKYGNTPGSYGASLIERDLNGGRTNEDYAQWAAFNQAHGYGPGIFAGFQGQASPQTFAQPVQNPQPQQQQPQQTQQQGDFFTQLMSILAVLLSQQQPARQRPPVLPQRANTGNYFSRFA